MAGGFNQNTSRMKFQLPTLTKPTGGGVVRVDLPKSGLLSLIFLRISATVAGTLSNQNALGASSIIRRVRLLTNSSIDLFSVSGPGYAYMLQEMLESEYGLATPQNQGRTAVSAATFNLDMVIPVQVNLRDPIGLFMLGNEQTLVTLEVEFEADASVATGATVTATVKPYMQYFTVPRDVEDYPPLNVVHQIDENTASIPAAGEFIYTAPRGNTYMQIAHGAGIGASGSDLFTRFQRRANQTLYFENGDADMISMEQYYLRHRARAPGAIIVDFMGNSGLGSYGTTRDFFNSARVTDYEHVFTMSGSGTLYTIRRMLVPLAG